MKQPISSLLVLLVTSSCASSYVPRPGPRVSLVMDGGTYGYVREGKKYEGGLLGGDIVEAVRGNPRAEEYARAYKTGLTTGFVATLLGAGAAVAGIVVSSSDLAQQQQQQNQSIPPTGPILIVSGLVVELIGSIIIANAHPHLFDAINAYNDGLPEPAPLPVPSIPRAPVAPTDAPAPAPPVPTTPPPAASTQPLPL